MIDATDDDDDAVSSYVSRSDGSDTNQITQINSYGRAEQYSLNLAAAYKSGLHLGANLNVHNFRRNKDIVFSEVNNFAEVGYIRSEFNYGAGLSANFGFIYKTQSNLRLGAVYQTPTYYSISTEVDQFITVITADETTVIDPGVIYEYDLYSLRTPGKLTASAAYIFGKKGLLSFEYNTQDFSNMEYGSDFAGASETNSLIEDTYERVHTYKLGAEIRNQKWSFRGGISRSTSPYQDQDFGGDSKGYSLGIGHDWGQWRLDAAYNNTELNTGETTFENSLYTNTANIEEKRDNVTVTLGLEF